MHREISSSLLMPKNERTAEDNEGWKRAFKICGRRVEPRVSCFKLKWSVRGREGVGNMLLNRSGTSSQTSSSRPSDRCELVFASAVVKDVWDSPARPSLSSVYRSTGTFPSNLSLRIPLQHEAKSSRNCPAPKRTQIDTSVVTSSPDSVPGLAQNLSNSSI